MVVTVTKTLVLEHEEEKALALYKRLELSEELSKDPLEDNTFSML